MPSYVATISPKGQVTIPTELRQALGLAPGDQIEFQPLRDHSILIRPLNLSIDDLLGSVGHDGPAHTLAEIEEGIAVGAAESATAPRRPKRKDAA